MGRVVQLIAGISLLLCFQSPATGQGGFRPLTDLEIFGSTTLEFRKIQLDIKDIEGSPYLSEEFSEGKVLMNNMLYDGVNLRYNVYNDRFEVNLDTETIMIDPVKNTIDTLYYLEQKFVRKFLNPEKSNELSHVEVLYSHPDGNLLKKYRIELIPATQPGAYTEAQPAKFKTSSPFYYLERPGNMVLYKGVRSLAEFFATDSKEIKKLIKTHRFKLQDEKDLTSLCALLSTQSSKKLNE
jgi:hypothetical protein